jgi:anthranilate/para-aminobenzoate synthase component I
VRLEALDPLPSFALLGPGFGGGRPVLLTDLEPEERRPALLFAPFETAGAEALAFAGRARAVEVDPGAPAPAVAEEGAALDADAHAAGVGAIREAIAAGDVYQVNLTIRVPLPDQPGSALAAAMWAGGMPRFGAWVRLPRGPELVSSSPELLFEIEGSRIRSEPMKGTAAAGDGPRLEASEKDRAELAMITDLVRNDITPICHPRTVRVTCERRLLALPYAAQAVSDVEGELLPGVGPREALAALHPGGSVTGAPKPSALEMIRRLEPGPRGAYCGALALCVEGRATASLLIRTASRTPSGWVYGVGGGIVHDSDAAAELEEIRVKLGALGGGRRRG